MIISASRRTDIPAFYSSWFINRLRERSVDIANPFNPKQISRIDLSPDSVDCIVFWTRNPRPLLTLLDDIDRMGYRYYFLYTITGYPRSLEENLPTLETAIATFKELSDKIGPEKVIWRYDPIVLSSITDENYHKDNFEGIASKLTGRTKRAIVSMVDMYRKVKVRLKPLSEKRGISWFDPSTEDCLRLISALGEIAYRYKIEIQTCAEDLSPSEAGIKPGACIDTSLINELFGLNIPYGKDKHQREKCLCAKSIDIGAYNTCGYRCIYCYASNSLETAVDNLRRFKQNEISLARTSK